MNDAYLYNKNNSLQKRDSLESLDRYAMKIKWKRFGARVIDIGCGDGSVTTDILKSYIPHNYEKLFGCDISKEMVKFANEHHRDERTTFTVLDIEDELPIEMKGQFDHVFSFYALHWIKNQEMAFKNIFKLMTEGGDCFLVFLGQLPAYELYRVLSQTKKWHPWLKDVEKYISPYHDSQEPEKEIKQLMEGIGFKNIEINCEKKLFIYNCVDAFKKAFKAVNPFNMPEDVYDDFIKDSLDVIRDMQLMDQANNNEPVSVRAVYTLIHVYGCK